MRGFEAGRTAGSVRVLAAAGVAALALSVAACSGVESPTAVTPPVDGAAAGGDGSATATATSPLLGTWKLVSLQQADGPAQPVPPGTSFQAEFRTDGRVAAVVDCNRCNGGYTATADALTIGAMACTRAYCVASAPFDSHYETLLSSARSWRVQGKALEIRSDGGVLKLER